MNKKEIEQKQIILNEKVKQRKRKMLVGNAITIGLGVAGATVTMLMSSGFAVVGFAVASASVIGHKFLSAINEEAKHDEKREQLKIDAGIRRSENKTASYLTELNEKSCQELGC